MGEQKIITSDLYLNCQVHELTTRGRYEPFWGLFSHPDREMQVINRENERFLTITPTTFC